MLGPVHTRRHPFVVLLVLSASVLLASCSSPGSGSSPGDPDPDVFTADRAFGGSAPSDAVMLDPQAFEVAVGSDGFRWEGETLRAQREAASEARLAADLEIVQEWIDAEPEAARLIAPPDPADTAVVGSGVGSYLYSFENRAGEMQTVATLGRASEIRDLVAARQRYEQPTNQLALYRAGYDLLPMGARGGLPAPDDLEGAPLAELLEANADLDALFAGEVAELERAALASARFAAQLADPPPGFPGRTNEERSGTGGDRAGSCGRAKGGLYQNLDWPQKYFTTSVKNQGRRGTCVAFALTSVAETQVAVRGVRWTNLSEQFLYNRIKASWDPDDYDDGANTLDMAERFAESSYRLPYEDLWNYNPSPLRLEGSSAEGAFAFVGSCVGYDERCSDTAHQGEFVCTIVDGDTYCGTRPPNVANEGALMDTSAQVLWMNFPHFGGIPVWLLRAYLAAGQPVVAALTVADGFRGGNLDANGFLVDYDDETAGGHAVHVTGYVGNADLVAALPEAPLAQGGGYLIVKNSWGPCYGDGGFVYVPLAWAQAYFKHLTVFLGVDPSNVFTNAPPSIQILEPEDGASVPQGGAEILTMSAAVSDDEDGSGCCSVRWTSDLEGVLGTGTELEASFVAPGTHVITAVVTDSVGATARDSVTIEVVNAPPEPEILAPTPGEEVPVGVPYVVRGRASDPGNLGVPCDWLTWISTAGSDPFPLDGCNHLVTFETMGVRTLTLSVEDDGGAVGATSVQFVVAPAPDFWAAITEPQPEAFVFEDQVVTLSGELSQEFDLPATFTWYVHAGGRTGRTSIASGDVFQFLLTGSKVIPNVEWTPIHDDVGVGEASLELEVTGANGSASSGLVPIVVGQQPQ